VRAALLVALVAACGSGKPVDAPSRDGRGADARPSAKVDAMSSKLCVTKGRAAEGTRVGDPTVRAVVKGSHGDAAYIIFKFHGDSDKLRELASGQPRRQIGLKLKAQNSCNVIYVMWRLDPRPMVEVSVKRNPDMTTHKECGASGYTKVRGEKVLPVPALEKGSQHQLEAEITDQVLEVWIDKELVWRGELPDSVQGLHGPGGLRSDNVAYDLIAFAARGSPATPEQCVVEPDDSD
jgi:hypothetical protein